KADRANRLAAERPTRATAAPMLQRGPVTGQTPTANVPRPRTAIGLDVPRKPRTRQRRTDQPVRWHSAATCLAMYVARGTAFARSDRVRPSASSRSNTAMLDGACRYACRTDARHAHVV